MHHIEKYSEEFFIENGLIYRIVYGYWKEHCVPIYMENDEPDYFIRNIDHVYLNGWLMSVPGEKVRSCGTTYTVKDEDWYRYREPLYFHDTKNYKQNVKKLAGLIVELYPAFQYVLNKWTPVSTPQLMEALVIWKEHPDVEFLLATGFENLAFSPAFMRLGDKKKKAYCRWISHNLDKNFITYKTLQTIMCHGITYEQFHDYQIFLSNSDYSDKIQISYPIYKYLVKQLKKDPGYTSGELINLYEDYKAMARRAGHNLKDDYWKFPQHLKKAHDKVMEEVARIEEAERLAKEAKKAEEKRKKSLVLKALKKKYKDVPQLIDGYSIFISTDYEEWKKQAAELNQCICAGGYYQRMANGEFTIIFIQKDGIPQATAQIMPDGKINQFYGNERNRDDCLPSGPVREAFNKWLDLVPKSKFKKYKRKAA